eukprot:TRINITY_DN12370_c0_g1_i16.p1 TRINITY_DN12370_c0_g1~~TRINITY_DN12370_c0_g1_i16.p1  ORF type:complete len:206 (-),score=26.17 TRINITY_DN12370_c0_g1_i16:135-752(-)
MICLPMAISAYSVTLTKETPRQFSTDTRWRATSMLHHMADLAFPLLALVFQLFYRPWGIFALAGVYWFVLCGLVAKTSAADEDEPSSAADEDEPSSAADEDEPWWTAWIAVPVVTTVLSPLTIPFTAFETLGGSGDEIRGLVLFRVAVCLLLLVALAIEAKANQHLLEQLLEPHVLPIVAVTTICSVLLPLTTLLQWKTGRWQDP